MQREDAVLMLLATGPATRSDLVQFTGWGIEETNAIVDRLLAESKVAMYRKQGNNQYGERGPICLPQLRDAVEQARIETRRRATTLQQARRREVARRPA